MSLMRRSLLAAWSSASASQAGRSLAVLRPTPSPPPFSTTRAHPRALFSRAFSAAPGTGGGAQAAPDEAKASSDDGSSRAEGVEGGEGAVQRRSMKKFKWLAALALGVGATLGLAADELEGGNWSAGACSARARARVNDVSARR